MDIALAALAQHGPSAVLAGVVIYILWKKLQAEQANRAALQIYYEGDPKDQTKIGLVRSMQTAAQVREDRLRGQYEERIDTLHGEQKQLMREINETLRELMGEQ